MPKAKKQTVKSASRKKAAPARKKAAARAATPAKRLPVKKKPAKPEKKPPAPLLEKPVPEKKNKKKPTEDPGYMKIAAPALPPLPAASVPVHPAPAAVPHRPSGKMAKKGAAHPPGHGTEDPGFGLRKDDE